MVERKSIGNVVPHLILWIGIAIVAFPVYLAFIGSTHDAATIANGQMPPTPGPYFFENYYRTIFVGTSMTTREPIGTMIINSFVMAIGIAVGKISISIISAYAIVYFRFPGRVLAFWLIFITLMLPVEVRIIPTFAVVANLGLLNSYLGLTIPLIASATATFLFRQFFMTIPDELMEAARVDGAGPMKFFRDILLPLSRTNIAALCVILFIYGWMQYLWPLLVTTDPNYYTLMMGVKRMAAVQDADPQWNIIMAAVVMAMLPPILIVIFMQRLFVKGLVETEK